MSASRNDEVHAAIFKAGERLRQELSKLDFSSVAFQVYNPMDYGWSAYVEYVQRFAKAKPNAVFLGMNPGPWGMVQTGIPFGEVAAVRDWIGLTTEVGKPNSEHPKRPIAGFACRRSEVSGKRLWGLFADRFGTAENFFQQNFVLNYCPLAFMDEAGRNLTPDKFPIAIRQPMEAFCDQHLVSMIEALRPQFVVGIGGFAEACAQRCLVPERLSSPPSITRILHPSPASPAANQNWAAQATAALEKAGVW
jgi:single-strand selective monofunctional uracil DNA glycosylase